MVILLVLLPLAGKYWVLPAEFRWRIGKAAGHYWDGTLDVGRIEFNYFTPIRVRDVVLRDRAGRQWGRIDSATLGFKSWPSLSPVLSRSRIDRMALELHLIDGTCRPPIRNVPDLLRLLEQVTDIQAVTIRRLSLTARSEKTAGRAGGNPHSNPQSPRVWDGFELTSRRREDERAYDVVLGRKAPASPDGACKGRVNGRATYRWPAGESIAYEGTLQVASLELHDLLRAFGYNPPPQVGWVSGRYQFSGNGLTDARHQGRGTLSLAKGRPVPGDNQPTWRPSDKLELPARGWQARAAFRAIGSVVEIEGEGGQIANEALGFDGRPTGTIDLATGKVDLTVVRSQPQAGGGIKMPMLLFKLPELLGAGPAVVRVTGGWNAPGGIDINLTAQKKPPS